MKARVFVYLDKYLSVTVTFDFIQQMMEERSNEEWKIEEIIDYTKFSALTHTNTHNT